MILVGSSGAGELSVEATVDIGADTVAVVAGAQAVAQGDNGAELEEGEEAVGIQSKACFTLNYNQQAWYYKYKALVGCIPGSYLSTNKALIYVSHNRCETNSCTSKTEKCRMYATHYSVLSASWLI